MDLRKLASLIVALASVPSVAGSAQERPSAAVLGRVIAADDRQPIRFSLVYLVRVDSAGARARVTLTDSAGAFAFRVIPPGTYRVRIERIGYEPDPGAAFRLPAGQQLTILLRSAPRPVRIAPILVGSACFGAGELEAAPELAALWRQAVRAAEARRLFDRTYRYTVRVHEALLRAPGRLWRDSTWIFASDPTTAVALEEHGADLGYGADVPGGLRMTAPELPELFGASFLRTHCLTLEKGNSRERRIGFRPTTGGQDVELRGTIVLDSAFAVDRLEFDYLLDRARFASGALRYGDVGVPGGQIRFARRLEIEAPGFASGWGWRATTDLDRYRGFTRDTSGDIALPALLDAATAMLAQGPLDTTRLEISARPIAARGLPDTGVIRLLGASATPEVLGDTSAGRIVGQAVDADTRKGIPGVSILLQGTSLRRITDGTGSFVFPSVPHGVYDVAVEHLAYGRSSRLLNVPGGGVVEVQLRLVPRAVALDSIVVQVRLRNPMMERGGYYSRRRSGWGSYREGRDLERLLVTDILREVSRVEIVIGQSVLDRHVRIREPGPYGSQLCAPEVYLDGMLVAGGADMLDELLTPRQIEAIEVYRSMETPPELNHTVLFRPCGAVAVWTKR